jgi:hypothetical protein
MVTKFKLLLDGLFRKTKHYIIRRKIIQLISLHFNYFGEFCLTKNDTKTLFF